jgi:antitoxin component of MazEF toxin-antitoxin module
MRLKVIRSGSSRAIRTPRTLKKRLGLGDVVDVKVNPESLVLAPRQEPRRDWKKSFAAACPAKDEMLLERLPPNAFDAEEWTW